MNEMEDNSLHGATIERLALTKTLHKLYGFKNDTAERKTGEVTFLICVLRLIRK